MAEIMILSDKPVKEYQEFLAAAIKELAAHRVHGVALVALLDGEEAAAMTGYFGMDLQDKQLAAAKIQADVTEQLVRANLRQWLEEMEEEDDEQDQD